MFTTINKQSTASAYFDKVTAYKTPSERMVCVKGGQSSVAAVYVPANHVKAWRRAACMRILNQTGHYHNRDEHEEDYMRMFGIFFNATNPDKKVGKYRRFNIEQMGSLRRRFGITCFAN
jgi:hypothetical protein